MNKAVDFPAQIEPSTVDTENNFEVVMDIKHYFNFYFYLIKV